MYIYIELQHCLFERYIFIHFHMSFDFPILLPRPSQKWKPGKSRREPDAMCEIHGFPAPKNQYKKLADFQGLIVFV